MDRIKLMPLEDVERMFARLGEAALDVSGIRRKFLNCPYGENAKQALDIYLPNEGEEPFPVVVFVHGGGWSGGNKNDNQLTSFIGCVEHGYAVVSVGYRLAPFVRYPDNLFDIKAALRWLAENAETYLLDTTRTALTGASAGAQLAMMAAFTMGQPAFEVMKPSKTCIIRAVIDQFGPTNFAKMHEHYDESGYMRAASPDSEEPAGVDLTLGITASTVPNLLRFINPIDNIHPEIPPVLIFHGRYDPIVPYQQSVELFEEIKAVAGHDRAKLVLSDEFLHADPGYAGEESVTQVLEFLEKYM